ncbi:MAG TPA: efflux RND transporter periplasmic adaptor subunit, partial [Myxococcaceae bacterium]|nr:efflux RND transporter periplasmic adaptor subunit [Myxococcaceae bacterium]
ERESSSADPDAIAYHTCPMHPSVRQSGPGQCPICGMDLTPVTKGDLASGIVTVDEVRRQRIGVKIDAVRKAPLTIGVRAVGIVKYDERKLADVSLKAKGWIRGLKVDATGQPVKKGDVLFHLYSPELLAAQQEYLLALRTRNGDAADPLVRAARQRLRLWDIPDAQIDALTRRGEATETLAIRAPASGFVIEKAVVEGAAVEPGMRLYRIAALDRVWIEAQIYESDLPHVKVGQQVDITLPFVPEKKFQGRISYVYPYLQSGTRTGQVRIELPNPGGELKPEMYADVSFEVNRGERLQVPASAVIYTGPRRLVFVDLGEGRLRPREVKLGQRSADAFEVLDGLQERERVVTSGNFLIAAESRLRSAAEYWGGGNAAH